MLFIAGGNFHFLLLIRRTFLRRFSLFLYFTFLAAGTLGCENSLKVILCH
uniref:Uncharacterized protein n=1 Tax=Anguilla anguilla TaxID=7936 RepID=A0A0E9XEX1_ANGAN